MKTDAKRKIAATGIEMHDAVLMPLARLRPAGWNPRKIDEHALRGLGASISRWGLVQPIVWNKRSGNVVGGHQRLKVLESRGVVEARVVVVDLDDTDEKALNISLNNPEIEGDFTDGLQELLEEIEAEDRQLMSEVNLEDLLEDVPDDEVVTLEDMVGEMSPQFWMIIRGPLMDQAAVLQELGKRLEDDGIEVQFGVDE